MPSKGTGHEVQGAVMNVFSHTNTNSSSNGLEDGNNEGDVEFVNGEEKKVKNTESDSPTKRLKNSGGEGKRVSRVQGTGKAVSEVQAPTGRNKVRHRMQSLTDLYRVSSHEH